jgi:hypothetical protein
MNLTWLIWFEENQRLNQEEKSDENQSDCHL